MKLIIPNLTRRLDKYGGMKAWMLIFGYPTEQTTFFSAHDGSDYHDVNALGRAMEQAGYPIDVRGLEQVTLVAERDVNQSPIDVMSHLGLRWTYLDILKEIYLSGEAAIVLLDDMFLRLPAPDYEELHTMLVHKGGDVLGLDPTTINPDAHTTLKPGYDSPTEEAILWRPKGAERMIPLLIANTDRIIGDVIREKYPVDKVWTTTQQVACPIGEKSDWISDVHTIQPAEYERVYQHAL